MPNMRFGVGVRRIRKYTPSKFTVNDSWYRLLALQTTPADQ